MEMTLTKMEVASNVFVLCEASKLTLEDEFMKHIPCSTKEKEFKELLEEVIKSGLKDFYCPIFDPTIDEYGKISYIKGAKPATMVEDYYWWVDNAKEFCPKRGSRLGTKTEYIAFLGILIKKLIKLGWSIEEAWDAVCNGSKRLGDFGNTYKLLAEEDDGYGYWIGGGCYFYDSRVFPLADLCFSDNYFGIGEFSVGWIILER